MKLLKPLLFCCLACALFTNGQAVAQKAPVIESVSIFGDSSEGKMKKNLKQAYLLGKILSQQNKGLILNGTTQGILGEVLKGAYESGGEITLVSMPEEYDTLCPETHFCRKLSYTFTESPEEKEMLLKELGDVIVILPGGWEPLNIFMQVAHEQSLRKTNKNPVAEALKKDVAIGKLPVTALSNDNLTPVKAKPIIFLNINHYWDNLRYLIDEMKRQKVLSDAESNFIGFAEKPGDVLPMAQKIMQRQ